MKKFLIMSFCFLISLFHINKIVKAEESKNSIESSETFRQCMGNKTKESDIDSYYDCLGEATYAEMGGNKTTTAEEVVTEESAGEAATSDKVETEEVEKETLLPEKAVSDVEKPTFTENEKENEKKYADKFEELVKAHRIEELTKYIKEKLEATKELKSLSEKLEDLVLEYEKTKKSDDYWYAETVIKQAKEVLEEAISQLQEKFPGAENYSFDDFAKDYLELTATANITNENGDVPEVNKYGKTEKDPNKFADTNIGSKNEKTTENKILVSNKPHVSTQNFNVASNTKKLPDTGSSSNIGLASITSLLGIALTFISKKK